MRNLRASSARRASHLSRSFVAGIPSIKLIFGKVVALPSRTRITVQMWLHPLVVAFLAFLSYLMAPEAWRALRRLPGGDRGNVVAIVAIWSMAIVFFYVSARRIRAIVIK